MARIGRLSALANQRARRSGSGFVQARACASQAAVEAAKDPAQRALEVAAAGAKLVPKDTRSLYPATPTGSTDVSVSLAHTIRAILGPIAFARQHCERKYSPSVKSLN